MDLTVIVPTFNEGPNIAELVQRITDALDGRDAEILFVDDVSVPDLVIKRLANHGRHLVPARG